MIVLTGGDGWGGLGQLVMAIGLAAMLAYLAPAMLSLSPEWRRRSRIAASLLLGVALIVAVAATIIWFLR
jgi:hypothetical protein